MERTPLQTELIPYASSCPTMDQELISVLTKLCFEEEEQVSSDLLFVFSSNVKHKEIAKLITQQIEDHQVKQVIITGGIANYGNSYQHNKPESESIHACLPVQYQDGNMLLETRSKNMLENIIEAQKLTDFEKVKSISFICHGYASKRARLSLQHFFPNSRIHCIPFPLPSDRHEYPIDPEHWFKTRYGQSLILGEYLRMITYGNRGDFSLSEVQTKLNLVEALLLNK
ncbi:ElyC/SanA/YdcF family protein [Pedobacter gandavensis]|uniref:ElyC/SanA/YdcF family protein n=1 Tax=Pedobacter gandavensis TaxID=2679963 RepID=UPI0029301FF3|nr:ElyC/SanA/YdcF family protein [Pedobacter gandavensis]